MLNVKMFAPFVFLIAIAESATPGIQEMADKPAVTANFWHPLSASGTSRSATIWVTSGMMGSPSARHDGFWGRNSLR